MQLDAIGFNHRHERSFRIDRPGGSEDWLMLIVKSPACFIIDGKEIKTRANSFIVFTSDHPQHYFPECDEYFDDWIHFVPDSGDISLFEELNIPLNRPVPLSDIFDISLFVKNMCYEYYSSNANRRQSVLMYFRLLMYKLSEKQILSPADRPSGDNAYAEKLGWIRESIFRWPSREYTVDDMARELSLSRSRFQHLYSETFGSSVSKDILTSRMKRSSELLRESDIPVKDIALLVGYGSNVSYFVRIFRSFFGVSPGQYRKELSAEEEL